jgi:hypothetical protein
MHYYCIAFCERCPQPGLPSPRPTTFDFRLTQLRMTSSAGCVSSRLAALSQPERQHRIYDHGQTRISIDVHDDVVCETSMAWCWALTGWDNRYCSIILGLGRMRNRNHDERVQRLSSSLKTRGQQAGLDLAQRSVSGRWTRVVCPSRRPTPVSRVFKS